MIAHNPWPRLAFRIGLAYVVATILGLALDLLLVMLLALTSMIAIWQFYNIYVLERWLRRSRKISPPESTGFWGSILDLIYKLRRRDKKRSNNLAKILKRFESSALAIPDGVISINKNGGMEWWNEHATRLLGLKWPDDKGQRVDNLIRYPEFAAYYREGDHEVPIHVDSPINEELKLEVRIVDYGKKQRLVMARDISELLRLQQMRKDFVANVSHELRTPLTVLHGTAEILSDARNEMPAELHSSLDLLEQQSSRMAGLVNDLLTLSRLETSSDVDRTEEIPVMQMLEQLKYESEILSGEKAHEISLEIDKTIGINGSQAEITSCFSNLISNAVRYTPANGKIIIRWYLDNGAACFEVEDNGLGIAPEHLNRLTERFYRVDVGRSRSTGGTGLGLAIVKRILLRHDANLEVDSIEGSGSTFRCRFSKPVILT